MFYHAGFSTFAGGYCGVDVFFVVSGYLMTRIIAGALAEGRFSPAAFFERRVRRIIPAFFVVMTATTAAAWFFLLPGPLESFSESLVASALFVVNMYFWRTSGAYFAPSADSLPLLHLWSLGIEEQFYLVFPLALMVAWRSRLGRALGFSGILGLGFVGSLALFAIAGAVAPTANFYLLPTRAWEFLGGGLMALGQSRSPRWPSNPLGKEAAATLGLGAIIASILLLGPTSAFPWPSALIPAIGTGLLLKFADPARGVGRLLAGRPFVAVGLTSYSAYLWHQPILAIARGVLLDSLSVGQSAILLAVSFLLAGLSWRFVELPFRRHLYLSRRNVYIGGAAAILLLSAAGAIGVVTKGAPERLNARERALATPIEAYFLKTFVCGRATRMDPAPPDQPCRIGRATRATVAVFGDSHAATLEPVLADALAATERSAVDYTHSGCPPVLDDRLLGPDHIMCAGFNRLAMQRINADANIDTVVIAAAWFVYVGYPSPVEGKSDVQFGNVFNAGAQRTAMMTAFSDTVLRFIASGKRVILVYPVPQADRNVPHFLIRAHRVGLDTVNYASSYSDFRSRNAAVIRSFDALGDRAGLVRLYPERSLCSLGPKRRCRMTTGAVPLYFDNNHLTPAGSRMAFPDMAAALVVR